MSFESTREDVERLRILYPKGTRIQLKHMGEDPFPVPDGTLGTVIGVDDAASILMQWDNGSSLSLIVGIDEFVVLPN